MLKVVIISIGSVKGYSRYVVRLVDCLPEQKGYKSERNVHILWESDALYRVYATKGKGPTALAYANKLKAQIEQAAQSSNKAQALADYTNLPA